MSVLVHPLTYEDLLQTPDDGRRYEIIDGELYVTAAPIPKHQQISGRFHHELFGWVEPRQLGVVYAAPVDVRLGEHDVVEPDLVFIAQDRLGIVKDSFIEGPPDLLVEILSPSTRRRDERIKFQLYARAGVREYWIVDPEDRTVRVHALRDGAYELVPADGHRARSVLLPGFTVDIPALFANLA